MSSLISPKDLADAIGVSESSLKRWADDGLVRVSRTVGGHRRITINDAIRFIREIRAPIVRPDLIGLRELSGAVAARPGHESAEQLFDLLKDGRAKEARGLILSLYLAGQSVAEIADGPLRGAFERIGELWQHDAAGVFLEHRATDICIQAVQQLRQLVEPEQPKLVSLGAAPAGDPYLLPSLLASATLAEEGWNAVNLGADTPFDALSRAVDHYRPRLVHLSVSSSRDRTDMEAGIASLAARLEGAHVTMVLGGRASASVQTPPSVMRGGSLEVLAAIARQIAKESAEEAAAGSNADTPGGPAGSPPV